MGVTFGGIVHSSGALVVFMRNREVFYRERSSGMYNPGLWSVVQIVTEIIPLIVGTLVMQIPMYFMVNMRDTAEGFFTFFLATFLAFTVWISMATFLSSVAPNMAVGGLLQGICFGLFINFNGVGTFNMKFSNCLHIFIEILTFHFSVLSHPFFPHPCRLVVVLPHAAPLPCHRMSHHAAV